VAVLEWTGDPGKPSASRLLPVVVYDGEQLNDGTIYLNRPEPLALAGGTEYELQTAGKASGLFDVFGAGEFQGTWQGFGVWKPLSKADAAKAASAFNTSSLLNPVDAAEDDKPTLKRKHPAGIDSDDSGKSAGSSGGDAKNSGSGIGSDQPTMKRKTDDSTTASTTSSGTDAADPDRPTLKRKAGDSSAGTSSSGNSGSGKTTASSSGAGSGTADPDRPTIRRKHESVEAGEMETSTAAPDPDRPRLKRGKPTDAAGAEPPRLVGLPPTMQQAVAVSDAKNRAEHPWKYNWANPDDEQKMKEALEAMARTALGMDAPAKPAKPVRKTATAVKTGTAKKTSMLSAEPADLTPLEDEHFRVFELAYGATATLVLTASSPKPPSVPAADDAKAAPDETPVIKRGKPTQATATKKETPAKPAPKPAPQKFVTLVAQPDLYGGVLVLYKSVTDSAHLDETPHMRLVDAVDALGDNRGELLFELRGAGQRQFALFRVLRGTAEQLFATVAMPG